MRTLTRSTSDSIVNSGGLIDCANGRAVLLAGRDVSIMAFVNEVNISKRNDPDSKQYDKEIRQNLVSHGNQINENIAIRSYIRCSPIF